MDVGAFLEQHFLQITRNPRANLDRLARIGLADEGRVVRDFTFHRLNDMDFFGSSDEVRGEE